MEILLISELNVLLSKSYLFVMAELHVVYCNFLIPGDIWKCQINLKN